MNIMDMFRLDNRVAFVTGGGQGIGKCLSLGLAEAGADVAVVDINLDTAQQTAEEIRDLGKKSIAIKADVTVPSDVDHMVERIMDEFGRLDVAVNNAGTGHTLKAMEMSKDDFMRIIDVNLAGVFLCSQAAARVMKQASGGSIINIASMSAHIVNVPQTISVYNTSKAGVMHLTKSLAVEWAKYHIRVNSISPGYILTELTASLVDMHPIWLEKIPAGRLGKTEDLKAGVLFLASDASSYATGTDIIIDGGYTCL